MNQATNTVFTLLRSFQGEACGFSEFELPDWIGNKFTVAS